MRIVIFGLSISSSWGNGHATLWRGLCRALVARGHEIIFFERDVPYYAANRDFFGIEVPGASGQFTWITYREWRDIQSLAARELRAADIAITTSYCPDALVAFNLIENIPVTRVFYDLDTPITLERLERGETVPYIGTDGLRSFDLVLSYTGGRALRELRDRLGAKHVAPLYGSVDPDAHRPVTPEEKYRSDLSYLGTYAADRRTALERLFLQVAERLADRRFFLAGSLYPQDFPWRRNIHYREHLPPPEHPAFFSSSRLTLNITRESMTRMGYCPSGRLFEAAACGTPILSDDWEGLASYFEPEAEILLASTTDEAARALELPDRDLHRIGEAARERVLRDHTAGIRAGELESHLESALRRARRGQRGDSRGVVWGIIPAAGAGTRIQPLAFSKELLPVGSFRDPNAIERPRAVSEYLVERMVLGGASRLCFVVSPGKSDILSYYGSHYEAHPGGASGLAQICYMVQEKPAGLCDALFRAAALIRDKDEVLIGLPDTIWSPSQGFRLLPKGALSLLLFPVLEPELFDAVVVDEGDRVREVQVKRKGASSRWIWGAMRMPGHVFLRLQQLWLERSRQDEYLGTLFNAYIAEGGDVRASRTGLAYVDVGTLNGYREAVRLLIGITSKSGVERSHDLISAVTPDQE